MLRGFNQNGHGYSTVAMIFTAAFGVLGLAGMILGKAERRVSREVWCNKRPLESGSPQSRT